MFKSDLLNYDNKSNTIPVNRYLSVNIFTIVMHVSLASTRRVHRSDGLIAFLFLDIVKYVVRF